MAAHSGADNGGDPRLSIVVPAYDAEPYLAECLDSVLGQPFADFEVVLVDDGSTDATAVIAQRYAARDARIRLHRQHNAGLGAARNAGVRLARGELLAFVDADDWLPKDAYSPMVTALDRSGSDFAVGTLKRDSGRISPRMRANHAHDRLRLTIEEQPMMLADVFAVNKVFRRSFWDRADLSFPEGTSYEDQVALTRAFLMAAAFDVLRHTVYVWRSRTDGSSISQQRHELRDLNDRIVTKRASTAMVHAYASPSTQRVWHVGVLPIDMVSYFWQVPGCSAEYWQLLRAAIAEFWAGAGYSFAEVALPVQQRQMGWLVEHDRRRDLERLVDFVRAHPNGLPVAVDGERVRCLLPGADDPDSGIPAELYELSAAELRWEARLLDMGCAADTISLHGFALVRNVPSAGHKMTLAMVATSDTGVRADVEIEGRNEPRATRWVAQSAHDYDSYGFEATLHAGVLADLTRRSSPQGTSSWTFTMTRTIEGLTRSGSFTSWLPRLTQRGWQQLSSGMEFRLVGHDGELCLQLRPVEGSPDETPPPPSTLSGHD